MDDGQPEPLDPAVRRAVEDSYARQGLLRTLSARLTSVRVGRVSIVVPVRPEVSQQDGFVHAGVLVTLADHAAGAAGFTLCDEHETVLTSSLSVYLLRPAIGSTLRCEAQVLRGGQSVVVAETNVFVEQGASSKLAVRATVQLARVALPKASKSERPPAK